MLADGRHNGVVQLRLWHRLAGQFLQEDFRCHHKARRAIPALERKMLQKGGLRGAELAVYCDGLNRRDSRFLQQTQRSGAGQNGFGHPARPALD